MPLHPEQARPHDLPEALALLGRSQLPVQDVAERFGHFFVVREDDARVVAVAGLEVHGEDGLLRSVAVDTHYRSQGLAGELVEAVLERAGVLRLRAVYLLTTDARDYFARHGFTDCPREEAPAGVRESWEFRICCPTTAVLMRRPLA